MTRDTRLYSYSACDLCHQAGSGRARARATTSVGCERSPVSSGWCRITAASSSQQPASSALSSRLATSRPTPSHPETLCCWLARWRS
eukprot:3479615-Rhodomonas_salina.6